MGVLLKYLYMDRVVLNKGSFTVLLYSDENHKSGVFITYVTFHYIYI